MSSTYDGRILCLSGGIDSLVAWFETGYPDCVFFQCGHRYQDKESRAVRYLASSLNLAVQGDESTSEDLPFLFIDRTLDLSRLEQGKNAHIFHRNLLFSAVASTYVLLRKKEVQNLVIFLAGIRGDEVEDKDPQAFSLFSRTLTKTGNTNVKVESPFWSLTKAQVVSRFLNSDYLPLPGTASSLTREDKVSLLKATVACYDPRPLQCGNCGACFRRAVALVLNDIEEDYNVNPFLTQAASEYLYKFERGHYDSHRVEETLSAMVKVGAISPDRSKEVWEKRDRKQQGIL